MRGSSIHVRTVDCEPLTKILPFRQFHSLPQTSAPKRGFSELAELVAARTFVHISWLELAPRPCIAGEIVRQ